MNKETAHLTSYAPFSLQRRSGFGSHSQGVMCIYEINV